MSAKKQDGLSLEDRLQRREAELAALQRIAMTVAEAQDLQDILRTIVQLTIEVMGCPKAAIFELDEEAGHLSIRAWEGLSEAYAKASQEVDIKSDRAMVVVSGEPVAVADVVGAIPDESAELAMAEGFRAFIDIPLRSRGQILGFLSGYYANVHEFSAEEVEMFVSFADQASVALETGRLLRDQKRRITELASLEEVGRAISGTLDLDQLLEKILEQISRLMDVTNLFIVLYFEETEEWEVRLHIEDGQRQPRVPRQKLGVGLSGWIIRNQEPLLLKRRVTEFLREQGIEPIGRESKSWLGVPMLLGDHVLGVIAVQSYEKEDAYDERHMRILAAIARQAAVVIQNARYLGELERRVTELSILGEVGRVISGALDLDELLDRIYVQVDQLMDTTNMYIALYDHERDEVSFPLVYEHGERVEWNSRRRGEGLTEHILRTMQPLLFRSDVERHLAEMGVQTIGMDAKSWLGVPMVIGDQAIGVIAVQNCTEENAYDEGHLLVLFNIARQAAVAIQNAHFFRDLQESRTQLEARLAQLSALQEVSQAISVTLELDTVLDTVLEAVTATIGFSFAIVSLVDEEMGEVRAVQGIGVSPEQIAVSRQPLNSPDIMADIVRTGKTEVIDGWDDRFDRETYESFGYVDLVRVFAPLVSQGQVIGLIEAGYPKEVRSTITKQDIEVLQTFLSQAAIALANARLFAEIRRHSENLQQTLDTQEQLLQTIQQLSTPVVPLLEGILLLPLVGNIDSMRAQQIIDQILIEVQDHRARAVIIDITGVPIVDTMVAQSLVQTAQAVHLLGAEAVLVGIMPDVAQTMVGLGINLATLVTRSDLQSGLEYAMQRAETEEYELI